jgi:hypothetical protein
MKRSKDTDRGERGLYAHHDRGYGRAPSGYGPGAYGFEGSGNRRMGATLEDDYSDSYGYGSSFGESPMAKHGLGWADDRNENQAVGQHFNIEADPEDVARHRGRGPKGWKRSDPLVHDQVCETLMKSPDVDASDVEVSVVDGIVTLAGSVPDKRMRRLAEIEIHDIPGVMQIFNHLRIAR